jgi:TRAP-type C4-dicarboxylate transport system substrate-binding protein
MTKPVNTLDDLKNQKVRGYGYVSQTLQAAGASPVSMGQGEVYEALQRGVLNGTSGAPIDVMADRDFYEVAPNIVDMNYGNYAIAGTVINKKTWESLPADLQKSIESVNEGYLDLYLDVVAEAQEKACEEILGSDATITVLDRAAMSDFIVTARDSVRQVWEKDVASANAKQDAAAFFDAYEKALEKHSAGDSGQSVTARCAAKQQAS